ncbi:radical SAM protein [Olsenella sp. An285]|uniref:radical SAM protein n=1 Tax=Olsenella sp. An285 TaxID=1965621 RepID=UPI000B398E3F|nr:radical SAM protein [Olsenella sp. An285]OUO46576.1 radical SAM protein [Olsenella sp. An285]
MTRNFEPACRQMDWLDPFHKQVWERAFADGIPISGTFELTPRCNFNCKMCYVHLKAEDIPRHGRELSAKEWLRIAEEARDAGTTWVCVTGGEPLMHPEFEEIWTGLAQMGFFLTLQTNASLVSGKMAKLLERYPPRQAKVTLYGTTDEVYEAVCEVNDGFTRVNDGIHTLMSLGIPVELVSTIIQPNDGDVENMALYAVRHGLKWLPTGSVKPSLRGAQTDAEAVRLERKNIPASLRKMDYFLEHPVDPDRKPCTYCKDYRVGYWITWEGQMRFCSFLNEPFIPVRDHSFRWAWNALLAFEGELDWPDECHACSARKVCFKCAASLASMSGSLHEVPKWYCDKIRQMYANLKGRP